VATTEDLKAWYDFYGLGLDKAVDNKAQVDDEFFRRYHRGEAAASVVQIAASVAAPGAAPGTASVAG
jgi:hypothetical protein